MGGGCSRGRPEIRHLPGGATLLVLLDEDLAGSGRLVGTHPLLGAAD